MLYFAMQGDCVISKHHSLKAAAIACNKRRQVCATPYKYHVVLLKSPGYWKSGDNPAIGNYLDVLYGF